MKKFIKIFIVIGLLLFSIGLVSAEGNFTELQNNINTNNGSYNLSDNYIWNNGEFISGIVISDADYVLDGRGYTVNGNNSARIFDIQGNNVTIKNLNLINGFSVDSGGAINAVANVTIIGSNFTNNSGYSGGAFYTTNGHVIIVDSKFINNQAFYQNGGAIYAYYGNVNVNSSIFINNTARTTGGAIYTFTGAVDANNSIFEYNNASRGGAIFVNNKVVNLFSSTFTNNRASIDGGAILINFGNARFTNSTFINNTAGRIGGVIYTQLLNNFIVNNSVFINNNASRDGGAIFIGGGALVVIGSSFINNRVNEHGGAIYSVYGILDVSSSIFTGNFVGIDGDSIARLLNENTTIINYNIFLDENPIFNNGRGNLNLNNNWWGTNNETLIKNKINAGNYTLNNYYITTLNFIETPIHVYDRYEILYALYLNGTNDDTGYEKLPLFLISIYQNGKFLEKKDVRGSNDSQISEYITKTGENNFTVEYGNNILDSLFVNVIKSISKINLTVPNSVNVGETFNITIRLFNQNNIGISNETLNVIINGEITQYQTNNQGFIFLDFTPNKGGILNITVIFNETTNYFGSSNNSIVNVLKRNITIDIIINSTIILKVNPDATGNITLIIGNETSTSKIVNGTVIFDISHLPSGNYTGLIIYNGDDIYNKINQTFNFTINRFDIILSADNITMYFRNGTQFIAILYNNLHEPIVGANLTINMNGVNYTRTTGIDGSIRLTINLFPGNYIITTTFNSNPQFNRTVVSYLTVKTILFASDLEKYYKNDTQFKVLVLDGQGNPYKNANVSFNVHGVFYTRITNNEGIAILNINLNPGNYTITTIYNGLSLTNKIAVLPTLIGNDLTKRFGIPGTYNVKVLNNIGKPFANQKINVNIHGVFYEIISGIDGIAKLNINLNPGSYIATSTWNGYSTSNIINVKPL